MTAPSDNHSSIHQTTSSGLGKKRSSESVTKADTDVGIARKKSAAINGLWVELGHGNFCADNCSIKYPHI